MVLTHVFTASAALVVLSADAPTTGHSEVPEATLQRVVGTGAVLRPAPRESAFGVGVSTAAQNAEEVEAALGLDRPTRRMIQQGLRDEGFDPGVPDGLFGPRTRAAIRRWQEARGARPIGYLDGPQAEFLRLAGAAPPAAAESVSPAASALAESRDDTPPADGAIPEVPQATGVPRAQESTVSSAAASAVGDSPGAPMPAVVDCEAWNTQEFFETATASDVSACLAAGADIVARDDDRVTPLHWAAWINEERVVVETLLTAGADAQALNGSGRTPLHNAAGSNGNPEVVEALLAAGADLEARGEDGATPLLLAAAANENPAMIHALLAAGADRAARMPDGSTLLHLAARQNENPAVVEALVAVAADVQARSDAGSTPLHDAAWNNGNPAVVEALLQAGAELDAQDDGGRTPLSLAAASNESFAVVEALIAAGAGVNVRDSVAFTPLHRALGGPVRAVEVTMRMLEREAYLEVVEALLAAGADPSARFGDREWGYTPLMVVARAGPAPIRGDVIEALLNAGADPNAVTRFDDAGDRLPLHRAAPDADPAEIEAFLAAGADIEARETIRVRDGRRLQGGTALWRAARNENEAVLDLLLAAGTDPNPRIHNGLSALHRAARFNRNPATIERLLAAGASLEARDAWGQTPLHAAANSSGTGPATRALLAAGANTEARDEDGNTPLHLAARYADDFGGSEDREWWSHAGEALEALLEGGANANARNGSGRTPWDLAEENKVLRESDAYWRLNDARFNTPRRESRNRTRPNRRPASTSDPTVPRGPRCEIPGYPSPADIQNVGLNWCGPSVGFQRRAFALQAAGAWCAIAQGTSSSVEQVRARHQEINAACEALDALGTRGGPSCNCPAGYRP